MKPILIFSGTTEGKRLSERLSASGIPSVVCVATEYGELVMPKLPLVRVHQGRMSTEEMRQFRMQEDYLAVVDATHPFAVEVSRNIKESMKDSTIPYLRLQRQTGTDSLKEDRIRWFANAEECAHALKETRGNILLTTGSKELAVYAAEESVRKRLYVRVLPGAESLRICEEQGIAGKQIIAMQGPFSEEMNRAVLHQFDISCMVTKQSGKTGGFPEKLRAAEAQGIACFVIGSPKENGQSFYEVLEALEALSGIPVSKNAALEISLVGVGMGNPMTLTGEAKKAIEEADVLFGAERMLDTICTEQTKLPYYRAEEILPELLRLRENSVRTVVRAAVVFSGDTGFYSGCRKLYQALSDAEAGQVKIYPGISSVSYLAARTGIPWQDAEIISIHGRGDTGSWRGEILEAVRYHAHTFVLVSGAKDIQKIGELLSESGQMGCKLTVGYQLSYPSERVETLSPAECRNVTEEGLYVCLISTSSPKEKPATHGWKDDVFLRELVPMTKEEVREVSISKLHLSEKSIVYDVGSGTGSIAVEIAARSGRIAVYAIEQKLEAAELIARNCKKFQTGNVKIIKGKAPRAMEGLPAPTHAFIGGSGGSLMAILHALYEKNPRMRVVINAITLETVGEIMACMKAFPTGDEEIVQLQVSRSKKAGSYHLMDAENPIYIASFTFTECSGSQTQLCKGGSE